MYCVFHFAEMSFDNLYDLREQTISEMFRKGFIMSCHYSEMNWMEFSSSRR